MLFPDLYKSGYPAKILMKRLSEETEEKIVKYSIAEAERKMLNDQLRWCGFNKIDYGYRRNIIDLTKCIRIPRLEGMDIEFVEEFIIELKKAINLANNFKYNGYTYIID